MKIKLKSFEGFGLMFIVLFLAYIITMTCYMFAYVDEIGGWKQVFVEVGLDIKDVHDEVMRTDRITGEK